MKIGIDARVLYAPVLKGIGVYFQNLIREWEGSASGHEFFLYYDTRQETVNRVPKAKKFIERGISIAKGDQFYFWEQFRLPREVKKDKIDVFFSPANSTSGFLPCPAVVTVHDTILQERCQWTRKNPLSSSGVTGGSMDSRFRGNDNIKAAGNDNTKAAGNDEGLLSPRPIPCRFNEKPAGNDKLGMGLPWPSRVYYGWIQPSILRKAAALITPSEFSKKSIERLMKVPGEKITVIPQGMDTAFQVLPSQEIEEVKKKFGIFGNYIFNAGGESVWKNVPALIEAYSKVREKGFQEKLVITGIRSPEILRKHQEQIAALGIQGSVIVLGYVSKEELIALYSGAEIFVYPSLMEGFGFPPLEAMACGAPVAASDACSIPEVTGEAAVLFDGKKTEAIAEAMLGLLEDEYLRREYRQKGFERVKLFSWKRTAERTLGLILEAGAKVPGTFGCLAPSL